MFGAKIWHSIFLSSSNFNLNKSGLTYRSFYKIFLECLWTNNGNYLNYWVFFMAKAHGAVCSWSSYHGGRIIFFIIQNCPKKEFFPCTVDLQSQLCSLVKSNVNWISTHCMYTDCWIDWHLTHHPNLIVCQQRPIVLNHHSNLTDPFSCHESCNAQTMFPFMTTVIMSIFQKDSFQKFL